jgi:hypothetical protein
VRYSIGERVAVRARIEHAHATGHRTPDIVVEGIDRHREHFAQLRRSGAPQAVVITPDEFEELAYRRNVRSKVDAGIRSAELGKTWSLSAARDHLKKRIRARAAR